MILSAWRRPCDERPADGYVKAGPIVRRSVTVSSRILVSDQIEEHCLSRRHAPCGTSSIRPNEILFKLWHFMWEDWVFAGQRPEDQCGA